MGISDAGDEHIANGNGEKGLSQDAEALRQFYAAWGAAGKGGDDIQKMCAELNSSAGARETFNRKLRQRYHGTDLSWRRMDIEARRQEVARHSVSPLCKPIAFEHRFCVAPMVGQSDIAFRLLCLRHGASVCWTEMFYSQRIVEDEGYLPEVLQSCAEDRPLIVQICGNEPEVMAAAAAKIEDYCNGSLYGLDAIDINLGCPQKRAQEGHYGSYLLDRRDWELVEAMVAEMANRVSVPVTCKIRLLQTQEQTIEFARRLQRAGASLLTIHGRQRGGQRHGRRGPADLSQIAAVKRALSIPVVANGNITWPRDALENLELTQADGVMSAEGILANPVLFQEARELAEHPPAMRQAVPGQEEEDGHEGGGGELGQEGGGPQAAAALAAGAPAARRRLVSGAALEYLDLAHQWNVPLEVQRQHVSHFLGLSAATQRAGWVQRVSILQAGRQESEGSLQVSRGSGSSAAHVRHVRHGAQHDAHVLPPADAPWPLRLRQMKHLLNDAASTADLRDLVSRFFGHEPFPDAARAEDPGPLAWERGPHGRASGDCDIWCGPACQPALVADWEAALSF
jgi:nifR3 family TIM-barrel protein